MLTLLVALLVTECDPEAPGRCAVPLAAGEPAPFAGQLLSTELAVALGLKADGCDARVALELDFARRAAAVDLGLAQQLRGIDQQACQESGRLLQSRLADALAPPPVYEQPWFVAGVTAVLTVVVLSAAVWAAGQLK